MTSYSRAHHSLFLLRTHKDRTRDNDDANNDELAYAVCVETSAELYNSGYITTYIVLRNLSSGKFKRLLLVGVLLIIVV